MEAFEQFMQRLADAIQYPRQALAAAEPCLRELHSDPDDSDFASKATPSVGWHAERRDGPSPSEIGYEQTEDRDPAVERLRVARHFAGLFAFTRYDETPKPPAGDPARKTHVTGLFLVDVNHPERPFVYYSGATGDTPYWILPVSNSSFEYDLLQVRSAFAVKDRSKDDARNYEAKKKIVEERYPRARAFFANLLGKVGIAAPKETSFEDHEGQQVFAAYRAFLPIADVLVARANGDAAAKLSAADAKAAVSLAEQDEKFAPFVLAKLLGLALAGDMDRATAFAKEIQQKKLGVPLTQYWADMALSRTKAFAGS